MNSCHFSSDLHINCSLEPCLFYRFFSIFLARPFHDDFKMDQLNFECVQLIYDSLGCCGTFAFAIVWVGTATIKSCLC